MYPAYQSAGYDRAATMFSPDGRLYQVEYASKIVSQGTLAVALKYADGVIFGVDKNVQSRLIVPSSIEKLFKIDSHVGAVSAGLVGDARRLIQIARQKSQENVMYFDEAISVETLVKEVSNVMQIFTQYGGMRPFGVSLIIGGVDNSGKRLFEAEPSGALAEYNAIAVGKNKNKAMGLLEKDYKENLGFDAGVSLLIRALKHSLDEKERLELPRVEFAFIDSSRAFKKIPAEKIKSIFGNLK